MIFFIIVSSRAGRKIPGGYCAAQLVDDTALVDGLLDEIEVVAVVRPASDVLRDLRDDEVEILEETFHCRIVRDGRRLEHAGSAEELARPGRHLRVHLTLPRRRAKRRDH